MLPVTYRRLINRQIARRVYRRAFFLSGDEPRSLSRIRRFRGREISKDARAFSGKLCCRENDRPKFHAKGYRCCCVCTCWSVGSRVIRPTCKIPILSKIRTFGFLEWCSPSACLYSSSPLIGSPIRDTLPLTFPVAEEATPRPLDCIKAGRGAAACSQWEKLIIGEKGGGKIWAVARVRSWRGVQWRSRDEGAAPTPSHCTGSHRILSHRIVSYRIARKVVGAVVVGEGQPANRGGEAVGLRRGLPRGGKSQKEEGYASKGGSGGGGGGGWRRLAAGGWRHHWRLPHARNQRDH